ncbi:uncharacterized protein LACBIDRAFT_327493 [Laccaria bicolor S238N-H82]|uniref:Predicted protein n=1 Tax=Laccaria bicolor (strain S238N-H82 / ATCC MYA-4686) TaxID=486041 RepID=B0DBW4_LACBS|nr:uncharacterized protein LACBIDRAFT_327493 [Laccaria bicolor S238N-H82]EDR07788.1 predicted protein [Laccaria bicolor S238N-H82]|eukprot:XP_001881577.1 predicted protein [Laccaria bicolor S238N-H82]
MDGVVGDIQHANFQTYFQVAVTVAALYDHLITLDVERKKWSAVNVFFIINRYFGEALPLRMFVQNLLHPLTSMLTASCAFSLVFQDSCKIASKVQGWGCHVLIWSMQAIMLYRICCLYKHSRKLMVHLMPARITPQALIPQVHLQVHLQVLLPQAALLLVHLLPHALLPQVHLSQAALHVIPPQAALQVLLPQASLLLEVFLLLTEESTTAYHLLQAGISYPGRQYLCLSW